MEVEHLLVSLSHNKLPTCELPVLRFCFASRSRSLFPSSRSLIVARLAGLAVTFSRDCRLSAYDRHIFGGCLQSVKRSDESLTELCGLSPSRKASGSLIPHYEIGVNAARCIKNA